MKAKMLNQLIQRSEERKLSKYEKKVRHLDLDLWSTSYITDIPIEELTDVAERKIEDFVLNNIGEAMDIMLERNGMLGYWQFTVVTTWEVTNFDIETE
jgi:hypothetical protein